VKTNNPSVRACVTVSCKVSRSEIALYYLQLRAECVSVINSMIQSKPRLYSHTPNTHGSMSVYNRSTHYLCSMLLYKNSLVSMLTRLFVGRPMNLGSITGRRTYFLFSTEFIPAMGPNKSFIRWVLYVLQREGDKSCQANHLNLMPRLRIRGAIPPLLHIHSWYRA
jgi:hypothetical protein